MSIVLPFNLPHVAASISQIISLYDPYPSFQVSQNSDFSYSPSSPQDLVRNFGVASAGFPHSFDFPFQQRPTPGISPNNIPLPANSYVINLPSLVYGYGTINDSAFSVIQINTGLARLEPGFSRIRVDYAWNDTFGNVNNDTYYFDCPFYEGFNVTAREINNIVDYVEQSAAFLQNEIDILNTEVNYALSHEFWRGTSVSGRLTTNNITTGLQQGALTSNLFAHTLPNDIDENFAKVYQSGPYPVMAPSEIWNTAGTGMIQRNNFPGKVVQNNYSFFYTNNESHPKSCGILAENTDGTLTFWFFDTNVNNQDISYPTTSLTQSISYIGPISPEYVAGSGPGQGGGTFVFYVRCSGGGGSNSQPITSLSSLVPSSTAGSQYWWNAADQTSFNFQAGSSVYQTFSVQSNASGESQYAGPVNVYYPAIKGMTYDSPPISTSAGTNIWFRCLVKPSGGKGSLIHWANSNGYIDVGNNSSSGFYNDHIYSNSSSITYTGNAGANGPVAGAPNLTLLGPVVTKPTITGINGSSFCVGQSFTVTGSNLTNSFPIYINSTKYPCTHVTYNGSSITATVPDNCPLGPATLILYNGNASDTVKATNLFSVQGAPKISSISPYSVPQGLNVTITGSGFGSYVTNIGNPGNSAIGLACLGSYPNNLITIQSWSDSQIVATIPSTATVAATTLFVYTNCGEITSSNLNIISQFNLAITPANTTINTGATQQYSATLTNLTTNTVSDVTKHTVWKIIEGASTSGTPTSGDSTYGTINAGGLYTAPNVAPPNQTSQQPVVYIAASYQGITVYNPVEINTTAVLTLTPSSANLLIPHTQQFSLVITEGNQPVNITNVATWTVTGGASNGTITSGGLYTPPANLPSQQPITVHVSYVYSGQTYSTSAAVTLNSASMNISPTGASLLTGASTNFSAILTENNTPVNVTNYATWSVNGIVGGNSTYGLIAQGYYTAPATIPSTNPVTVTVSYVFSGTQFSANTFVSINSASISIDPTTSNLTLPSPQQFDAVIVENNIPINVTTLATWTVNGVVGGNDQYGTIYQGFYSPPVYLPAAQPVNIGVSYIFSNNTYSTGATINLTAAPVSQMSIKVESQINIYLGDGRFGYIPTGTQTIGYLNQYCFTQFQEKLLPGTRTPDSTYLPIQQLGFTLKNALDADIGMALYDTGSVTPQADGSTLKTRTVVLGLIDPTDGLFHSMWDIANPLPSTTSQSHSLPSDMTFYADKMKAFSEPHAFDGSIMQYIDDLTGGAQTQINALINQSNILISGNVSYDSEKNQLTIVNPLHIYGVSNEKTYGLVGVIPEQKIDVHPEEYVYIDSKLKLKVSKFENVFQEAYDTRTIILGTVLDSFYTTWPLVSAIDSDISGVKQIGDVSWMRLGNLLVQWGQTETYTLNKKEAFTTNAIKFPIPFKESCNVMAQAIETNGAYPTVHTETIKLDQFTIHTVNTQSIQIKTKLSWLAIGY